MQAIDAQCYSLVPVQDDRPVLISTSRHFTQGGLDLKDVKQEMSEDERSWIVEGKSNHLIKDDPYELTFVCNGYDLTGNSVKGGYVDEIRKSNGILIIRIIPDQSEIEWELVFDPGEPVNIDDFNWPADTEPLGLVLENIAEKVTVPEIPPWEIRLKPRIRLAVLSSRMYKDSRYSMSSKISLKFFSASLEQMICGLSLAGTLDE